MVVVDWIAIVSGGFSVAMLLFSGKYIKAIDRENRLIKAENKKLQSDCEYWKSKYYTRKE